MHVDKLAELYVNYHTIICLSLTYLSDTPACSYIMYIIKVCCMRASTIIFHI